MDAERPDAARLVAGMDARWDAAELERALGRLHRERRRRRSRVVLGAIATAAVMLLAMAIGGMRSVESPEPRGPSVIELADGSRIEQSEDGAAIVDEVSEARVRVRAERGVIRCVVSPRASRRFEVRSGDVTVTVLGTIFSVEPLADGHARVAVERGRVRVAWPTGQRELGAGETGTFPAEGIGTAPPETANAELAVAEPVAIEIHESAGEPSIDGVSEPTVRARPEHAAPPAAATGADWRSLARAERYEDAFASLHGEDHVDRVEDLLLAADVARLSGHLAAALPYLDRVLRDHPADARAPLASFTRGRVLAQLGRHHDAALELLRAHRMEPHGSLAEDALGRAALAHAAAGEARPAAQIAERYLADYPTGRWAARMRPLLEASAP